MVVVVLVEETEGRMIVPKGTLHALLSKVHHLNFIDALSVMQSPMSRTDHTSLSSSSRT